MNDPYVQWLMENLHLSNTARWNAQMDYRFGFGSGMSVARASEPKDYWTVGCPAL